MSAAQKALDALDKAERRACGRSACVGDGLDGMCDRCVVRNNLAVNLASPLAAVARAAMHYHATRTNYDALETALDALEAAAAEGGA